MAIAAPAGGTTRDVVETARAVIADFGVETILAPRLFGPRPAQHLSASVADRVADLHDCWLDESVDAIIAARGGFGSAQLLPTLDVNALMSRKMPLLGFSDVTALHLGMMKLNVGIPIAAPVAANFAEAINDEWTAKSLRNALAEKPRKTTLTLTPIRRGPASGPAIPLNLTVACSLLGTPFFPDLTGAILILEDLNEPIYKLDRCLTQLELAGVLTACAAVVFGNFHRCGRQNDRENLFRAVAERVGRPAFSEFPFGHRGPLTCLRFGTRAQVDHDGTFTLAP